MLINFKFKYNIECILEKNRKPDVYWDYDYVSYDIPEVDRSDTMMIALVHNKEYRYNHIREYIEYNGDLYTPKKAMGDDILGVFEDEYDDVLNSFMSENDLKHHRLKGIQSFEDMDLEVILQNSNFYKEKLYLQDMDKKIKRYYGDNKEVIIKKNEIVLDNCILIDGEFYIKTLPPSFKIYKDVSLTQKSPFHFGSYDNFFFVNEMSFYSSHIYPFKKVDIMKNLENCADLPDFYNPYNPYAFYGNYDNNLCLKLSIDMLDIYIGDNPIFSDRGEIENNNFFIFDMDFIIEKSKSFSGRLIFSQLFGFNNKYIQDSEENINTFLKRLSERYDFGPELIFHIKNCQENGYLMDDVIILNDFLVEHYSQLSHKKTVFGKFKEQNTWAPSDRDFFYGLKKINHLINNYKKSLDKKKCFNTKVGDKIEYNELDISPKLIKGM